MLRADGRSGLLTDGITAAGCPCDQCWLIVAAGCRCRGFRRLSPELRDKAQANCAKQKRETCHSEFTFHFTSPFRKVCSGTTTRKDLRLPGFNVARTYELVLGLKWCLGYVRRME